MAQNIQQLPPSKRFKVLYSGQMNRPLTETDKLNRPSIPTKKRTEVLNRSSASLCLPAKKGTENLYFSSTTSRISAKKCIEIDLNIPSASSCLPAPPPSSCLPAKKRAEILCTSSTSSCLPAKKRVWALNPLSPAKSKTKPQDTNSFLEEKEGIKGREVSSGVPVKKRTWVRDLLSLPEAENQAPAADPKQADLDCQINGTGAARLPAKKRVWVEDPKNPTSAKVPDLNTVPEKDQIHDASEVKEIQASENRVPAPKPLPAIQETNADKRELAPKLLPATEETNEEQVSAPEPLPEIGETNAEKRVLVLKPIPEIQETNVGKVLAPKLLPAIQETSAEKKILGPNLLPPIRETNAEKIVLAPNLLSASQEDTAKKRVSLSNLATAVQEDSVKKLALAPNLSTPIQEDTTQNKLSAPNPLQTIQESTTKKQASVPNPLTPALLGVREKDKIKVKGAKENHGIVAKKRVYNPNPSSAIQEVTEKKQVLTDCPLSPAFLRIKEKDHFKDLKETKEIQGLTPKKRVRAPNPLSLENGETIKKFPSRKKVHLMHPLSPIPEEKDETENHTKVPNEISTVLVKKRIWAPQPSAPVKTQIEQHNDPKLVKLGDENKIQTGAGDKIHGVPLLQEGAVHPLAPANVETQNEKKGSESVEEEIEIDDGVLCAVCQSTDGEPSDPIVFCDGCDLMVHASCYGNPLIKSIPEGDWFCSACSSKAPRKEKRCCLCPVKGGALKPTVDGKWAHVMCALLVPEVFFQNPEGRDGIDCSKVPCKRWQKDCFICGRNYGCAINCAESKCKLGFHVSCGLEEGLCIEYKEGKGGDIVAGFCTEHTKLWKKQQLTGKFKIVSKD